MIAFIFPGQGSQFVGMGADLRREFPTARRVFKAMDTRLGFPLSQVMLDGIREKLDDTRNAQPAILAHSVAIVEILRERGIEPDAVAGHSLGEYSAIVAARALEFEDAVELVRARAVAMGDAADAVGGAMSAVIGLPAEVVERLAAEAAGDAVCVVANYNTPVQTVISGERGAVARAGELAREAGARSVIPLKVSGAFHSPLMAPAAAEMLSLLDRADFRDARIPVVSNVDAVARTDAAGIRAALAAQVTGRVLWSQCVHRLVELGADRFVEVGPGQVLTKMMKQIAPEATVHTACDAESLLIAVERLGS